MKIDSLTIHFYKSLAKTTVFQKVLMITLFKSTERKPTKKSHWIILMNRETVDCKIGYNFHTQKMRNSQPAVYRCIKNK